MRGPRTGTKIWLLSSTFLFNTIIVANSVQANQPEQHTVVLAQPTVTLQAHPIANRVTLASEANEQGVDNKATTRRSGISCVPYARQVSGIRVVGNAWQWWKHAVGLYARGDQPEVGSVLNFRSNGRMVLGHVAVVRRVVNPREVIIDHSNWSDGGGHGNVSRNVAVVDVSEANNWSAVRVELGRRGTFGSVYPTYGFIYNRPDVGFVTTKVSRPAPQPDINPVPADLRPVAERPWRTTEEVAESVEAPTRRGDARSKMISAGR